METKDARRKRKLGLLIAATKGGLDAVAIAARRNPDYLKQIIKSVLLPAKKDGTRSARSLGDDAAETIEDAYNLGRGWFDSDRPVPSTEQAKIEQVETPYLRDGWPYRILTKEQYYQILTQGDRDAIEAMALALLKARDSPEKQTSPEHARAAA